MTKIQISFQDKNIDTDTFIKGIWLHIKSYF